jgi:hypothetical protein
VDLKVRGHQKTSLVGHLDPMASHLLQVDLVYKTHLVAVVQEDKFLTLMVLQYPELEGLSDKNMLE